MILPRLYSIVDTTLVADPATAAEALLRGGVKLLQYRHKAAFERRHYDDCCRIAAIVHQANALFIVNDRVDIAMMCGADGVHLGQDDLPPEAARKLLGPGKIVGYSTHHEVQLRAAEALPIDYLAIGPVFATTTKVNPDPVVGLAGVTAARRLTLKPLVAIGGITRENAASVIAAGADSVAVVRDLLATADLAERAELFSVILAAGGRTKFRVRQEPRPG